MLNKKERLTKKEFDRSFSMGKRIHTPELQLIWHPSETLKAAAVVGKKVYKRAVDRNRARRQIYAAIAGWAKEGNVNGTFIVIAKPAFAKLPQTKRQTLTHSLLAQVSQ